MLYRFAVFLCHSSHERASKPSSVFQATWHAQQPRISTHDKHATRAASVGVTAVVLDQPTGHGCASTFRDRPRESKDQGRSWRGAAPRAVDLGCGLRQPGDQQPTRASDTSALTAQGNQQPTSAKPKKLSMFSQRSARKSRRLGLSGSRRLFTFGL